jgi:hypothetical protein
MAAVKVCVVAWLAEGVVAGHFGVAWGGSGAVSARLEDEARKDDAEDPPGKSALARKREIPRIHPPRRPRSYPGYTQETPGIHPRYT